MKDKNTDTKACKAVNAKQGNAANRVKNAVSKNQFIKTIPNPPMTEQTVAPPPHVWNKIEHILNMQDKAKAPRNAANVLSLTAAIKAGKKKQPLFLTPFGITVLACVMLLIF